MKFSELPTGTIFAIEGTHSYPKLKLNTGYVDIRDEIYRPDIIYGDKTDIEIIDKETLYKDFEDRFGMCKEETDKLLKKLQV